MSDIRIIDADAVAGALARDEVREFWNVLTEEYFTGDVIPGSRWVPLGRVGQEAAARGLAKDTPILVYCSGPTCPHSGLAARKLATLGFTNVRLFEGGLAAWKESGRAVEAVAATA